MSDRSSATLFAKLFQVIEEHVPAGEKRDTLALEVWEMQRDYDFAPYQMYADDALLSLGLARRGVNPDWPDEDEVVLYGPQGDE